MKIIERNALAISLSGIGIMLLSFPIVFYHPGWAVWVGLGIGAILVFVGIWAHDDTPFGSGE